MKLSTTEIDDTYAEAFTMRYTRLVVTAHDRYWLDAATDQFTGYGCSVIACDAEAGQERLLDQHETPDGRIGAALLAFGFSAESLGAAVANRVGQCLMTCPSTAVFDGLPDCTVRVALGKRVRYFGDGYQKSKLIGGRRYWRIPVMEGEFLIQDRMGVEKGVAGGNFIIQAVSQCVALEAARRAVEAIAPLPGTITPFPGGAARSGSKVGSRYKALKASTADAFCPTLRGRVPTRLHPEANSALEIVIDGVDRDCVARAMNCGIRAAVGEGVVAISAGNYEGKLGKHLFPLHEVLRV